MSHRLKYRLSFTPAAMPTHHRDHLESAKQAEKNLRQGVGAFSVKRTGTTVTFSAYEDLLTGRTSPIMTAIDYLGGFELVRVEARRPKPRPRGEKGEFFVWVDVPNKDGDWSSWADSGAGPFSTEGAARDFADAEVRHPWKVSEHPGPGRKKKAS